MNVNMQPLLELFVIYVLLWKKFNFAYEASRSFFISTLSMKKKKKIERNSFATRYWKFYTKSNNVRYTILLFCMEFFLIMKNRSSTRHLFFYEF